MAKLIHILAASVGGGLVLGASIRLGEALGSSGRRNKSRRGPAPGAYAIDPRLKSRLDRLEKRVQENPARFSEPADALEWQTALSGVIARMDRQQDEMAALQGRLANQVPVHTATVPGMDLQRQIREEIDRRLADVEQKLELRLEAANGNAVSAMLASIENRLAPRIERLESEINDQSAAVAELRDCSLQSERSIQRLLAVLERTISPKGRPGETGSGLSVMSGRGQR